MGGKQKNKTGARPDALQRRIIFLAEYNDQGHLASVWTLRTFERETLTVKRWMRRMSASGPDAAINRRTSCSGLPSQVSGCR